MLSGKRYVALVGLTLAAALGVTALTIFGAKTSTPTPADTRGLNVAKASAASGPQDELWVTKLAAVDMKAIQPSYTVANVKDFGAKGDGVTDDTAALQNALDTKKRVFLPKGTYKIDGSIQVKGGDNETIALLGELGTVIDGTASSSYILIELGGQRGPAAPLKADADKGASSLTATLACSPGDILLITSKQLFNPNRPYYWKGEMVEVASVSGGVITLKNGLQEDYNAVTTDVYKLVMPKVDVKNIEIRRDSNSMGLKVEYARKILAQGCKITGARLRDFYFSYIYGGNILSNFADDCWFKGTGTSYGISIATSQYLLIKGNETYSGRHGIAHGGWEPCRFILLTENIIDNYHESVASALDFHEDSEYIAVINNRILNGVMPTSRNLRIENNYIVGETRPAMYYYNQTPNCDYLIIRNNRIETRDEIGVYILFHRSNEYVDYLEIAQNTVVSNAMGIVIRPHPGYSVSGSRINKLILQDNSVTSRASGALWMDGADGQFVAVNEMTIGGVYDSHTRSLLQPETASGSLLIKDASFRTATYPSAIFVENFESVAIDKSVFEGARLKQPGYSIKGK